MGRVRGGGVKVKAENAHMQVGNGKPKIRGPPHVSPATLGEPRETSACHKTRRLLVTKS